MSVRYSRSKNVLSKEFTPLNLVIRDDSALHANHGNVKKGDTETHFYIKIISPVFNNKTKIAMHKMVYKILDKEFSKGLHSLELDLRGTK